MGSTSSSVMREGDISRRASILIIEDDALVASSIQEVLEELGFAVSGIASSGPEALSLASREVPDLALVDIRLAGPMDGIELAGELLRRFSVRSIFLSGAFNTETMARARGVDPLGFLAKPFRPSQVFNALQLALGARASAKGQP
jgi:two-component system, response regulator PdtaR